MRSVQTPALPAWPVVRGSGAMGGGGCFAAGTLVSTPNGETPIESLRRGDPVLAYGDNGAIEICKITATVAHANEEVWLYKIWGGKSLYVTPNHWVLNQFNAFVEIGTLSADDMLTDELGHLRPIQDSTSIGKQKVYNLLVERLHTYIANGIRVHNGGLGPTRILGSGAMGSSRKPSGGGGRSPIVADDNLNSTQYARVLFLLGEGEQEGFPSARSYERGSDEYETACLKDIFINGTPILKATADPANPKDSDFNYEGISVVHTDGTAWQTHLGGFNAVESQRSVGLSVTQTTPITRTIRDENVDAVRITLQWPALQQAYKEGRKIPRTVTKQAYRGGEKPVEGDLIGATVEYEIQTASAGGAFKTALKTKLTGRTGDAYQRSHEIPIRGPFPVDIRVLRITKDSKEEGIQDAMIWQEYTELVYAKLSYPYSALLGLQIDAKYFNSWPQVSVRRRALKVPIPDNATVDEKSGRLIYSGIWTGTFAPAQWTTDPAWILHELICNCRWGFGQHCQPKHLDKWSFYKASQYSSALVPDGRGGTEPRFSCNVNLQTATEAYELINQLASVFRAMAYWGEGLITISQDAPSDPVTTISNADITPSGFRYAGASLRMKHTVAVVKFFDMDKQDVDYEFAENKRGIELFGAIPTNIDAFACTSRGQAKRIGEWLLYTEEHESEVITFETTLAIGAELRPGNIFNACDLLKTGARRGGKVVESTTTEVLIDQSDLALAFGPDATIIAKLPNGSQEIRVVGNIANNLVTVATPFSQPPMVGGTWAINNNQMKAVEWRCLSIEEKNRTSFLVSGVRHNKTKYDYIERNIQLETEIYAALDTEPLQAPSRIASTVTRNPKGENSLNISWPNVPGAVEYAVSVRKT